MSLADQSQRWYPTSVQVTVLQARGLRVKGKNGTNDAYAVMQVAKDKFATSVVEKSVAPMWKEEATFDLPLFHHGNAERCTLHVHVMHRALVGPDKLLGQAAINLLELNDVKSRNKTEWFKLLDKAGKPDKDRGEVLLDIQFMRNNMTASMFDLSATDKHRSRLGKFKDKVRGKKKEGISDTASAIVPSFTQVLTDSEEEGDAEWGAEREEKKKKHKLKSLFSPKSNLQKNMSQSMSVLGPLPEKNSSLSGRRSSGFNVDSSEGKKKFNFMIHKRSGSSDSKGSQGPLSLLRRQKQGSAPAVEQSNLCINGSHVYSEEPQPRTSRIGSTFSLASSGLGSMEELRRVQGSEGSGHSPWTEEEDSSKTAEEEVMEEEEAAEVERRKEEEEEEELKRLSEKDEKEGSRKIEEEERIAHEQWEKNRLEEEERIQQERKRIEEEEKIRMDEEERVRKEVEEMKRLEEQERMRMEEERKTREEEDERVRKEEQERIRMERKRREEEEERVRKEEEDRIRMEEERKMGEEEEERVRKEEQARIRMEEERKRREEEEERFRMEEEDRIRMEKKRREEEEEDRIRMGEERKRREEEEERVRMEEEDRIRMGEERKRREEEEERVRMEEDRIRMEEERKRKEEEEERVRMEEEDRIRMGEERKRREEEEERVRMEEDRIRMEEERKRREEEEETVRMEEEDRIRMGEERKRREEEEERVRKEEDRIRMEGARKRREEEEERVRMEEEDRIRMEEERKRREEEEERVRTEEDRVRMERKRREEEEERVRKEEEDRIRMEEERKRREEEEERVRKEEEDRIRMEEERREEEEERRRKEEEDSLRRETERKMLKEEEEKLQKEEERLRIEEEERRLRDEKDRLKRAEEENRLRKEDEETEMRRLKEKTSKIDEHKQTDGEMAHEPDRTGLVDETPIDQKIKVSVDSSASFAELASTNLFDDMASNDPFEEIPGSISRTAKVSAVKPRYHSAVPLLGNKEDLSLKGSTCTIGKEPASTQRDKRPAPQPPRGYRTQRQIQREQNVPTVAQQRGGKEAKTSSVFSQRLLQTIAPLSRSSSTRKDIQVLENQSSTHCSNQLEHIPSTTGPSKAVKHNKGPAPSRPHSSTAGVKIPTQTADDGPLCEPKHVLSSAANRKDAKIPQEHDSAAKQVPVAFARYSFEDNGAEIQLTDQNEITPSTPNSLDSRNNHNRPSVHAGSPELRAALPQIPEEDQTKNKSSKAVRAPLPPPVKKAATSSMLINQGKGLTSKRQDSGTDVALLDNRIKQPPCPARSSSSPAKPQELSGTRGDDPQSDTISLVSGEVLLVNWQPSETQPLAAQSTEEEAGGKQDGSASTSRSTKIGRGFPV
ncbi:uncharacterized protein rab11fip1b isoform 2-T2 [Polymixia lowei]